MGHAQAKVLLRTAVLALLIVTIHCTGHPAQARLMIVGNDERISWNAQGTQLKSLDASRDTVCIVDISANPENPRIIATLPLISSVYGPPTNLIISPDEKLALVANPMKVEQVAGVTTVVPDNLLHLIDLEGTPKLIKTIKVDEQPSGMDLSANGSLLLIANRAGQSVSVLSVKGKSVELVDTVTIGVPVADVSIAPDGRRALIVLKQDNKIGILTIKGHKVTYDPNLDINVGISPYNVEISPNGHIALTANSGVTGGNDGNTDTVSVIDLTAQRPHVINAVADLESERLLQKVTYLSVVSNMAPMLGLMGTVQGMIFAFKTLGTQSAGATQKAMLALNISQALYTTMAGLSVAVPAVAFYYYFRNRANNIILNMVITTIDLIKDLRNVEVVDEED